jgi:hypothetical protein
MQRIGPQELSLTLTEKEAFGFPPPRRTLCPRYENCLEHAANQWWTSFTCRGCHLERLILAGRLKELSPPPITIVPVYHEYSVYASIESM